MFRLVLSWLLFFGHVMLVTAAENMPETLQPNLKNIVVCGPSCGVYSLYACLVCYGKYPPIEEILTPNYVGSSLGSTAEELIQAAEKYNLYGKCYGSMTWRQLYSAKGPMILHFRGSGNSDFNHWVAFLGIEGGLARVIDMPHEMAYLSMAELLAQWDGVAVLLSDQPIHDEPIWESRFDYFSLVLFLFGGVCTYKIFFWSEKNEPCASKNRNEFMERYANQFIALSGAIVFFSIFFHAINAIGFLKNPTAVAEVTRRYYAVNVPEVSLSQMQLFVVQNTAVIYDARCYGDFENGTIPHTISFPINSDLAERKKILQGINKSQKIIVYCQSAGCGYSDDICAFLKFNGYRDISIYRGGYWEWKANIR